MKYYFYNEEGRVYLVYEGKPETNLLDMPHIYCEDVYENVYGKNKVYYVDLKTRTLKVEYEDMLIEPTIDDKVSNLSINNANLLKDSATKTIDITNLKKHNATILIDNANKTKQINNLNKNLATVTLELAKLKAQK